MMNEQNQGRLDNTSYENGDSNPLSPSSGRIYEIQVTGHLDTRWSDWLEGLEMKLLDNGEMILSGPIPDQSALMGVLNKLSRLNLALLSVNEMNKRIDGGKEEN